MTMWLRLAMTCVRTWTRLYTAGLPPAVRHRRRAEVDSDLWESLADNTAPIRLTVRCVLGIPDDMAWRLEHAATFGAVRHRSLTLSGQVLGAAFLICAFGVIRVDALRKLPVKSFTRRSSGQGAALACVATTVARFMAEGRVHRDACADAAAVDWSAASRIERAVTSDGVMNSARAQSATLLAFDAASVKLNTSGLVSGHEKILPGGRYTSTNLSLLVLIRFAYDPSPRSRGLAPFEVIGGPSWIGSDRFDVNATAGRDISLTQLRSMLRTLLGERFHLQAHLETRHMPVYRMVLAQRGKLGTQLRRSGADCASAPLDPLRGMTPGDDRCGYFGPSPNVALRTGLASQAFRGLTMEDFGLRLQEFLSRRVIDDTGLSGYFDADFEFTTEIVMPPPPPGQPNPYDGRVLPSIFSVLPQQLGLSLESERGLADILVIDSAEHPTPD